MGIDRLRVPSSWMMTSSVVHEPLLSAALVNEEKGSSVIASFYLSINANSCFNMAGHAIKHPSPAGPGPASFVRSTFTLSTVLVNDSKEDII